MLEADVDVVRAFLSITAYSLFFLNVLIIACYNEIVLLTRLMSFSSVKINAFGWHYDINLEIIKGISVFVDY